MNKKLLTVGIIAIVLLLSVSVISATDSDASGDVDKQGVSKSISVKVKWTGDASKMPENVTVDLLRDGSVVDTAVLSKGNSWSATFNVNEDGSYKVLEKNADAFDVSVKGNADTGFEITNKIVSEEVIGASEDSDNPAEEDNAGEGAADGDDNVDDNAADENGTDDTNGTDDNATDDVSAPAVDSAQDNATSDDASDNTNASKKTEPTTKEIVTQKIIKYTTKNPTKVDHKTCIPMVILVVAVMCAAFIPFVGRKR